LQARNALTSISTDLATTLEQANVDLWTSMIAFNEGNASAAQRAIATQFSQFFDSGGRGAIFDQNLLQGATNINAFLEAGSKIREFIETAVASGEDIQSTINVAAAYRQQLIDTAGAYGANVDAITNLVRSLGLADDQLASFRTQAEQLQAAANTPATPTPKADTASDAEKAKLEAENSALKEQLRLASVMAAGVSVNVYPPFGDPEAIGLGSANRVAATLAGGL
jgi:transposase-like protein